MARPVDQRKDVLRKVLTEWRLDLPAARARTPHASGAAAAASHCAEQAPPKPFNLYSLVQCAKANGLEPYAYLRRVFTELPRAQSLSDVEALLPTRLTPADLT